MVGLTKLFHLHVRRCPLFRTTKYRCLGRCLVYCFKSSPDGGPGKVALFGDSPNFSYLVLSRKTRSQGHFVTPADFFS
jgi:hypothetical protein